MAEKSVVIPMPMLQKDEKSYNDMVDILDQGEKWIREIYHKAGVIQDPLNDVQRTVDYRGQHAEPDQPNAYLTPNDGVDPLQGVQCSFGGDQ